MSDERAQEVRLLVGQGMTRAIDHRERDEGANRIERGLVRITAVHLLTGQPTERLRI